MKQNAEEIVEEIARRILNIETLEAQLSDSKDFHSVAVWELKEALLEAYASGEMAGH